MTAHLTQLNERLCAVAFLAGIAAAQQSAVAQIHNDLQAEMDSALSRVTSAMDGPGIHVINQSPDILALMVQRATLQGNQPRDIQVTVKASAQVAGLFLSMGSSTNPNVVNSGFTIELGGPGGLGSVTMLSGFTLNHFAEKCAAVGQLLGLNAALSGTGVRITSQALGSNAFVSVRMLQSIHRPVYFAGIYRLNANDTGRVDRGTVIRFATPAALIPQIDFGQDVRAYIDRRLAQSQGAQIALLEYDLYTTMRLSLGHSSGPANAQTLGSFRAFTLVRD